MRRSILIIIIVAIVALGALLVYFFLFRDAGAPMGNQSAGQNTGSLTSATDNPAGGLTTVSPVLVPEETAAGPAVPTDEAVAQLLAVQKVINAYTISPVLTADGQRLLYYDRDERAVYTVSFLGTEPKVEGAPSEEPKNISWSPTRERFVYATGTGAKGLFTLATGAEIPLDDRINGMVFVGDGRQICYRYFDSGKNISNISVGTPELELSDFRSLVLLTGMPEIRAVPLASQVGYFLSPNATRKSAVNLVSLDGTQQEIIVNQAGGVDAVWSPDGSQIVFSQLDGSNGAARLYLADSDGKNVRDLGIDSFVDKVAWRPDKAALYISVPRNRITIDRYYQPASVTTDDQLYRVDLNTLEKKLVMNFNSYELKTDARNLFFTADGKLLYFREQRDGSLWAVNVARLMLVP